MPVNVPDLDDRTYADMVQEGISLLPRFSRAWTNHNAADPGVTLLELFAYLADVFLYRLNRVTVANRERFLKLLTGAPVPEMPPDELTTSLRKASLAIRSVQRAITADDYERIAVESTHDDVDHRRIRRVLCLPRRQIDADSAEDRQRDRPGHTSIVFVPGDPWMEGSELAAVEQTVREYFEPRRLIASRVHISGPRYVEVRLTLRLNASPGASRSSLPAAVRQALRQFFDPLEGGPENSGWPFGRNVFASDVYRVVKQVGGVESAAAVEFAVDEAGRLRRNEFDEVIEVDLAADELVRMVVTEVVVQATGRSFAGAGAW